MIVRVGPTHRCALFALSVEKRPFYGTRRMSRNWRQDLNSVAFDPTMRWSESLRSRFELRWPFEPDRLTRNSPRSVGIKPRRTLDLAYLSALGSAAQNLGARR